MGTFFNTHLYCLVGSLSMTVWTRAELGVLYACVLYFCICACSAQLSMFHMDRCSRNTPINSITNITIFIIIIMITIIIFLGICMVSFVAKAPWGFYTSDYAAVSLQEPCLALCFTIREGFRPEWCISTIYHA